MVRVTATMETNLGSAVEVVVEGVPGEVAEAFLYVEAALLRGIDVASRPDEKPT